MVAPPVREPEVDVAGVVHGRTAAGALAPPLVEHIVAGTRPASVPWRLVLGVGLAIAFVHAALLPLSDIDLPMHLAVGEWIARHHAVPFVEPFAWTRAGAPYYAYSWIVELSAYLLLSLTGPVGLHLLHALIVTASVGAVVLLGRASGWRPFTTFLVAVAHAVVLTRVTPALRPQAVLYALVPLAWTAVAWLGRGEHPVRSLVTLFVASALAAGSHILFPLTGAPVFVLGARPPARKRLVAYAALAVVAGWLCSPYALAWPEVFRLNFAPNLLFRFPTGIDEYLPGFIAAPVFGALLAALPWVAVIGKRLDRVDLALGMLWLVGLIGFAHAEKALTVWWLVSLPLVGRAAARVPEAASTRRTLTIVLLPLVLGALLCVQEVLMGGATRAEEGTAVTRTLPGQWAEGAEPAARWLEAHARPRRPVRLFTTFNYGSYLTWRLPGYSASIDSRTIFPDSVAAPEAMAVRAFAGNPLGPWRSADVAVVPVRYPVAAALDTASAWMRLPAPRGAVGLWARRAWWDSVSQGALDGAQRPHDRAEIARPQLGAP